MKILFIFFVTLFLSIPVFSQNNALTFSSDYITIGSNMGLGTTNVTAECWVNLPTTSESGTFINIGGDQDGYAIGVGSGTFETLGNELILIYDMSRWIPTGIAIGIGWHHVAFSVDGVGSARAYVDGKEVHFSDASDPISPSTTSYIGASTGSGGRLLTNGTIDEVRIWNIARDEGDIRATMYQELVGDETNLVAYYKFNETSGQTLNDATTNNYNGTLSVGIDFDNNNNIPSSAFFGPKKCYYFNGTNSYISLGNNLYNDNFSGGTAITIEYWYRGTNLQSPVRFQGWEATGIDYVVAGWGATNPQFIISTDGGAASGVLIGSDAVLENDTWHHIACTWEKNTTNGFKTYVDGILSNQKNSANVNLPIIDYNGLLGAYHGPAEVLTGELDEVRIWSDVRTPTEIRENMNKTLVGDESGLVAYYNFDEIIELPEPIFPFTPIYYLPDYSPNTYDGRSANIVCQTSNPPTFNTWLNTNSSAWGTASNWSTGSAPVSTGNVGIYNYTTGPASSADLSINNLYLGTDANFNLTGSLDINGNAFLNSSLNIANGKYMTVDGELSIADISKSPSLTIASGGSLITNGTVSGNTTIEKTLSNDSKWHLISIPITGETSFSFLGDYLQYWDESTGLYEQFGEEEASLDIMKGYSFWGTHEDATYSFTGTPITGEQSISITASGSGDYTGANLLGNPYPSAIDWDLVSGYGAVYYWNGTAYLAYPETGELGTGSRYIPPMQGFFIVTESSETFNLPNNSRTHTGASSFYKSSEGKSISNGIVLQASNGSYLDELIIAFNNESVEGFEKSRDAFKFLSNTQGLAQLYSFSGANMLSIDVRPETELIQLGFQNNQNNNYQISLKDIDGIAQAEIEDTKLNTFHDLSQGAYEFDWNTTDSEERFILHLKATGTQDLMEQEAQVYSSDGQIYIRQTSAMDFQSVQIFDLAGRVIYSGNLNQTEIQSINLSNSRGAYLVQLMGENASQTEKIIIK